MNADYSTPEPHYIHDSFTVTLFFLTTDGEEAFIHESKESVFAYPSIEPHNLEITQASL